MTLFRPEVMHAQSAQWLGGIRIGRQPRFEVVALFALALGSALIGFAIWGEATRKVRVAGLLTPLAGSLSLAAQATGTVQSISVAEGDWVNAGQILLTLNTDRAAAAGNTAALVVQTLAQRQTALDTERQLRELQTRQRHQALSDRMRALRTEADQAERDAEGAQRRVDLAQRSVERYRQLAESGFVAEAQAQQKQDEWLDLKARADAARRAVATIEREWQSLQAEHRATALQGDTEQAQLERSAAALAQERAEVLARQTLVLTAPKDGVMTALHVHAGMSVQSGQVLATLVPQAQPDDAAMLEAHLYAPSRTTGFVRAGQPVWLHLAAYPYQKFGMARGEVSDVSRTPVNPQELPPGQATALLAAAQSNEPLYRIRVKLNGQHVNAYGQPQPLTPGMALEADVIQDRRTIWEWVFEPLMATRQQMKVL